MSAPTIVVFCHLRWDFVFQRPQQLLTRLAESFNILLVEEPVFHEGGDFLRKTRVASGITVCTPHTSSSAAGFHDDQLPRVQTLLAGLLPEGVQPIVWFYTPMAMPLLQALRPELVVYDCMDELSAFKNPPRQLLQRETALLARADIVFTGGPSLYEAKRNRHGNVWCFPSSVDTEHFGKARDRSLDHPDQADVPHPRLGFYGVIDERFDTSLLDAIARARPEWQLIMVGPVVKIDPVDLPRHPNIHYMGQRSYEELPAFLAGWDVCLMPFAMNESTRFISPTKVLEYMAAELPTVSTPVHDVAVPYGHLVSIAATAEEFVAACDAALNIQPEQRLAMQAGMREVVAATSWQGTARQMAALLKEGLREHAQASGAMVVGATQRSRQLQTEAMAPEARTSARRADLADSAAQELSKPGALAREARSGSRAVVNPLRSQAALQPVPCVVVGAGPTGLSAAYHLGKEALLLERHATVGGWCRSIIDNGFTFDHADHIMFSNDPYVLKLYDKLLGSNLHWQNREAWVYSKQVYTRYPFQGALYGLPPAVIKECILGAVEARYGAAEQAAVLPRVASNCSTGDVKDADAQGRELRDCCADGTVELVSDASSQPGAVGNFEQFIYRVWGKGIAKHFAIPYNRKLWTVPLSEMETSWLGGRVPLPDLEEIIEGALAPVSKPMGPNARFGYPVKGGFQALMNGFLPHIRGKIELNANVVQLLPQEHLIALADGRRFRYDDLISTMPLPELIKLIGDAAPAEVRLAARGLQHISIRCVNIGVQREAITDKHWIYYPEDPIFHRIFVQGNASKECNAPGGFGFTCEISYSPSKPLPCEGDALIARCIDDCIKVGMLRSDDVILAANEVDMPYAYVLYDHARAANVELVRQWLAQYDVHLAGRYSEWEYYNSDHAFLAGKKAAEKVQQQRKSSVAKA
jgi:UDP-galactopyranose mutase